MPVKKAATSEKAEKIETKEYPRMKTLDALINLDTWDVEVTNYQISKNGMPYANVRLSGENCLTYYAIAFGELATQLHEGTYEDPDLVFEVGYKKDKDGKILGYQLFLRQYPF